MPGGVGGAVQATRFAGGLGVAATRAGRCPPGAIAGTGATWAGLPAGVGRSDRVRGCCYSRRGLRSASSAGPLLLGAVLCRGVPWLASGFPGGLWTDGAAFSRAECLMKLNRFCNERFLCVKCGKFQLAIVQYVK